MVNGNKINRSCFHVLSFHMHGTKLCTKQHTLRAVGGCHGDGRDAGRVGRGSVDHEAVLQDDDAVGVVLRRHPARTATDGAELGVECRAETHADVTGAVGR